MEVDEQSCHSADETAVEEIAVESTRELLWDRHRRTSESVHDIAAGLRLVVEDDEAVIPEAPTEEDVLVTAAELRDLADFLDKRVVPLVSE